MRRAVQPVHCTLDNDLPLVRDGVHVAVMAAARAHLGDVAPPSRRCALRWRGPTQRRRAATLAPQQPL